MNVQSFSLPRGAIRRVTHLSLVLALLFIGISVVFGEVTYPLQPGGGISPGWGGPVLPEIPELLDPPALPAIPTIPHPQPSGGYVPAPATPTAPTVFCDPFADLYGRNVLVHLEGDQVISGYLLEVCQGYVVLEQLHIRRTFVVNTAKVLYFEATDV